MKGVLDTSVFIASEQRRAFDPELWPDEAAISVVTLAELELGVHTARSEKIRAQRLATLRGVQANYVALPIDETVASAFAELVATVRSARRRAPVQDTWIAATAKAHSATVFTQDADFVDLPGVDVVRF